MDRQICVSRNQPSDKSHAKQALRHGFVAVDARNVSFCRLSRHGQNCSRHHRENAEQGVAVRVLRIVLSVRCSRPVVWLKVSQIEEPHPL